MEEYQAETQGPDPAFPTKDHLSSRQKQLANPIANKKKRKKEVSIQKSDD